LLRIAVTAAGVWTIGRSGRARMLDWNKAGRTLAAVVAVATMALVLPEGVAAHGRGRGHRVVVGGFYGFGPYFGPGFGPYFGPFWGPYAWGPAGFYSGPYGPQGGVDMNVAMMTGFGALEINAKPNHAEVWVDGTYYGEARDLDGYPSYLWLEQGPHKVTIYKGGYASFEEKVLVQRGMKRELKVRLEKGDSRPPGTKPEGEPVQKPKDAPEETTGGL
jgi:PEGA domain